MAEDSSVSSTSADTSSTSSAPQRISILHFTFPDEQHTGPMKRISIGKRRFALGFNHWAVKLGDYWFEIGGESKRGAALQQQIFIHELDSDYTEITLMTKQSLITYADAKTWCEQWLRDHPSYKFNDDNCQKFVKEAVAHFGDVEVQTENKLVGDAFLTGGIATGVIAFAAIVLGLFIKGGH